MSQLADEKRNSGLAPQDFIRRSDERGHVRLGWLDSRHSFSFGHYYDPQHMGLSTLRVINDDRVKPGQGFPTHGHRDMEIISYILKGEIQHKDSMGNAFVLKAGDVQRMSAGTGIRHSEFNASSTDPLRFLQIWITPNQVGLEPSYQQSAIQQTSALTPLVTPDGRAGSLMLHQDVLLSRLRLANTERYSLEIGERVGYLHVIKGVIQINNVKLGPGDAMGVLSSKQLDMVAKSDEFEALWFELPIE